MEFTEFIKDLLHIDDGFDISRIERDSETEPLIRIYLEYQLPYCEIGGIRYSLYDHAPVRTWQHLCWFEYPCFIVCRLPRYIDSEGKVKTMEVSRLVSLSNHLPRKEKVTPFCSLPLSRLLSLPKH